MWRNDADTAIVTHKLKHAFNRSFIGAALERDFKAQITRFGIDLFRSRNRTVQGQDFDNRAKRSEIPKERHRIHAVAQYIAAEA